MSIKDFTANVISASKVVPDGNFKDSKASGVWDINEALDLIKGGNWPNAANINPSTFVDGLFQCHLYEGNNTARTITNNIDLSGEGGLVWFKSRESSGGHSLYDTARGVEKAIYSNNTNAQGSTGSGVGLTAFNSNGFSLGTSWVGENTNNDDVVSWTFRKAPKFFDVVTYTGNGSARTISHNLGSAPSMILIKQTNTTRDWVVYHHSLGTTKHLRLNDTSSAGNDNSGEYWGGTTPTSTQFSLGNYFAVNQSGGSYVAYLFAHNNGDGGFGPNGDQDVIKCGSYTGNGSVDGPNINLGFEPQWIMLKKTNSAGGWYIFDAMRGMPVGGGDTYLQAEATGADQTFSERFQITPTGFKLATTSGTFNGSGNTHIYMAIRRGPLAEPTSATDVFQPVVSNVPNPNMVSTNLSYIDMAISKKEAGGQSYVQTRLTGDAFLKANGTDAETTGTSLIEFDHNNKMRAYFDTYGSDHINYFWKRAPGYFDVVAYTGTGSNRTVNHNLGVVPEMMWVKCREGPEGTGASYWVVYHKNLDASAPEDKAIYLDTTGAAFDFAGYWNDTAPTSTVFTLGTGNGNDTNASGKNYIAYLFATVAGVSKVGSFSHTNGGGDTNVDCGFSSGARLVIYKRTDSTGSWYIFDSVRGIVSGSGDAQLELNNTGAENTGFDLIDPYSSGFKIPSNATGTGDYIFYAIA